ncbi:MAG: T9SS type A sorting domain-containing protein, partial [candidate division Zixibacteria bacterium]|nr:T9SS type A sorting domain-containing protein [candidate division Zixibacteria bacterium]
YLEASFTKHLYGDADGNPVKAMYYSWLDYPYYRDLIYGQNYFGDPTLNFYQNKPLKLDLDISSSKGQASFYASINNAPIPDVTVSITMNSEIIEEGLTGENGYFESDIDLIYGNDYYLTAYAENGCTIFRTVYSPTLVLESEEETDLQLPEEYSLSQNYPNPFNPTTTISYSLPKADDVSIEIYNILGQVVNQYYFSNQSAGSHSYIWNSTDHNNQPMSSGIYFYRLRTSEFIETKKMTLLK